VESGSQQEVLSGYLPKAQTAMIPEAMIELGNTTGHNRELPIIIGIRVSVH
jgi:hypothetical protein